MVYNILNGDALAFNFSDTKIEGNTVVVREGLIEGDLSGSTLDDFWHCRAKYLGITNAEYHSMVVNEFEKIMKSPEDSIYNLWFEYDLFCQVNMWFTISVIYNLPMNKTVYAVNTARLYKKDKRFWSGFGHATKHELITCYNNRIPLAEADMRLAHHLWIAYKSGNLEALTLLAENQSRVFPYLQDVVKAHVDRFPKDGTIGRPEKVIKGIINSGVENFHQVFVAFNEAESIYGFGDIQLKHLFDKVTHSRK